MRIDSWWVCSGVVPVARCERNVSVADTTMSVEHGRQMNDIGGRLNPTNGCDTEGPLSLASYEDEVVGPVRYRGCEESTGLITGITGGFTFALFLFSFSLIAFSRLYSSQNNMSS